MENRCFVDSIAHEPVHLFLWDKVHHVGNLLHYLTVLFMWGPKNFQKWWIVSCFVDSSKITTPSTGLRKLKAGYNTMEWMILCGLKPSVLHSIEHLWTIPREGYGSTKGTPEEYYNFGRVWRRSGTRLMQQSVKIWLRACLGGLQLWWRPKGSTPNIRICDFVLHWMRGTKLLQWHYLT
jgi:hypothetical protein